MSSILTLARSGVVVTLSNLRGPQGQQGAKGDTGETGLQGPQGPQGEPGVLTLEELTDVEIAEATAGEVLRYNGTIWQNSRAAPTTEEWDDVQVTSQNFGTGASAPDLVSFGPVTNMLIPAFDGNATMEQLFGQIELPHDYKEGTDIKPHVHWVPTTNGAGNIKWNMAYSIANVNAVFGAQQTLSVVDNTNSTAWRNEVVGLGTIPGAGVGISALICFRLWRDPTDVADTYAADAGVLSVGFHYQKDSFGSRQEYIK